MQGRWCGRLVLAIFPFAAIHTGLAQESGHGPGIREPEFIGQSEPASEWMVWRAFYNSLQFYLRQSPQSVENLLEIKVGIAGDTAARFLNSGNQYLKELERLNDEDGREIRNRFNLALPESIASSRSTLQRRQASDEDLGRLASRMPQTGLREKLEADGSMARFESKRESALARHQEVLETLLDKEEIADLMAWIDADVRDHVRVTTTGVKVAIPDAAMHGAPRR